MKAGEKKTVVRVTEWLDRERKVEYSILCAGDVYRLQETYGEDGHVYRAEFDMYFRSEEAAKAHAIESAKSRAYVLIGRGLVEEL